MNIRIQLLLDQKQNLIHVQRDTDRKDRERNTHKQRKAESWYLCLQQCLDKSLLNKVITLSVKFH